MATDDLHRPRARAALRRMVGVAALGLSACTSLGPFEGPQPNADEHALCYTRAATTPDQLRASARDVCGAGVEPRFVTQEMDLSACPLLVPMRLHFTCGG